MDADHVEAARLINAMAEADAAGRAPLLAHFIEHCREHFAREEAMMAETAFFATACHAGEHERVLDELATVQAKLAAGDAQDGYFQRALPEWLLNHRNSMDFVTAEHARGRGKV